MRILFLPLLLCCAQQLMAQGTLKIQSGAFFKTKSGAQVVLKNMNLQNDGSINQDANDGYLVLRGSTNDTIRGSAVMKIDRLIMAKDANKLVTLEQNLNIGTEVMFSGGILDVSSFQLDLGNNGILKNENESSRAFSSGSGIIQASRSLQNPSNKNPGNLGAVLTSSEDLGVTVVKRGHMVQNVAGAPSINRYYDLLPANNNNLRATVRLNYFNAEVNNLQKENLSQWKNSFNDQWDLNGADIKDTTQKFVEKANNNKIYRMTLATAISPSITCPANILVIAVADACSATVSFTGVNAATATGYPTPTISYRIGKTTIPTTSTFPVGTTIVTAVASDGVQDVTCDFTVTVIDNTAPTITYCPPSDNYCYNSSNTYTVPLLTASDACEYSVSYSISGATTRTGTGNNASGIFNTGTNYINWTLKDASNNTTTCQTIITVVTKGKCTRVSSVDNVTTVQAITIDESELIGLKTKALPNPSFTYFTILTQSDNQEPLTVRVLDILGRVVEARQNITANGTLRIGSHYRPGTYLIEVVQGNQRQVLKVVKTPQ